jgi:NAD-reducing hydrogenase large subunit
LCLSAPLSSAQRERILEAIPDVLGLIQRTLGWFKPQIEAYREEIRTFANFPSYFMGLVNEDDRTASE